MSNNLLFANMSVNAFCDRALRLHRADQKAFVNFVLSGIQGGHQAVVDPILNAIGRVEGLVVRRDYDSLLGIDDNVQVKTCLTVYPLAKKEDTLATNVHLKYRFTSTEGDFIAPIHEIPNLCIAKWGTHNMIRVLIPELYSKDRSQFLSQAEQKVFYEQGLLPAVQFLSDDQAAEWPATYDDEMFRARGRNGQLNFQTKVIAEWLVEYLGDYIRIYLEANGCSWATGLVFLHQIRGVKHSSQHSLGRDNANAALVNFLQQNQLLRPDNDDVGTLMSSEQSKWWVDVGLEVASQEKRCLAWRTDSHFAIVKSLCGIDEGNADRLTTPTSSQYTRDMASHLTAVSGCRIAPGPHARSQFGVQYVQLYTTDKSLIYRPDRFHHGKFITPADILKGKGVAYAENLFQLYRNAAKKSYSLARVEVRVPLEQASRVLRNVSEGLLRDSLLSFSPNVWWSLRAYRCLAIKFVLEWQESGDAVRRAQPEALLLTLACSWTLNGIHSTPDKGASSKELMDAILPHVDRASADPDILMYGAPTADDDVDSDRSTDSEDDLPLPVKRRRTANTAPACPYGLLFFRPMCIGIDHPVPRFRKEIIFPFISEKTFKYFFGVKLDEIELEFFRATLIAPAHPSRVQNKARRTPHYYNWGQDSDANAFDLTQRGYQLTTPPCDEGSDLSEDENEPENLDIDKEMTSVWRQFLLDITSKAPNSKRAHDPSHIVLSQEERTSVNEDTYKNSRLSSYFRDCQWKIATHDEWNMVFRRLWPDPTAQLAGKVQNYTSTVYYPKWQSLLARADAATIRRMRASLKEKFDELYWMPFAQTDRIWGTKYMNSFRKSSGFNERDAAPQIMINPYGRDPTCSLYVAARLHKGEERRYSHVLEQTVNVVL
ncbi:hypothetical protein BDZ97DRAFT_1764028 [Flammula alnicola]|nr:hypothetical protein BDZ97DRAFT_1764028 [Flammula alnicola]